MSFSNRVVKLRKSSAVPKTLGVLKRRAVSLRVIDRAKASGEFREDADPQLLIDMVCGPIYYRLLVGQQPLDER